MTCGNDADDGDTWASVACHVAGCLAAVLPGAAVIIGLLERQPILSLAGLTAAAGPGCLIAMGSMLHREAVARQERRRQRAWRAASGLSSLSIPSMPAAGPPE